MINCSFRLNSSMPFKTALFEDLVKIWKGSWWTTDPANKPWCSIWDQLTFPSHPSRNWNPSKLLQLRKNFFGRDVTGPSPSPLRTRGGCERLVPFFISRFGRESSVSLRAEKFCSSFLFRISGVMLVGRPRRIFLFGLWLLGLCPDYHEDPS